MVGPVEPAQQMASAAAVSAAATSIREGHEHAVAAFFGAVRTGSDVHKHLLDGVDINTVNDHGHTALHLAAMEGHLDVCGVLLAAGANVNAPALLLGTTPLHFAAQFGHREVCNALFAAGADANASTNDGKTPLHDAAATPHHEVCKLLLAAGANVNIVGGEGSTPLHIAVGNGFHEVCDVLLAASADPNAVTTGIDRSTPLHIAAARGFIDLCNALIVAGANVNAAWASNGNTPLHLAAIRGHRGVCKTLLAAGANVNAAAKGGGTPLKWVSKWGGVAVRMLLVAYGANITDLRKADLAVQLPKYVGAVQAGGWMRRVSALSAWVEWHDAADGMPSLAARLVAGT